MLLAILLGQVETSLSFPIPSMLSDPYVRAEIGYELELGRSPSEAVASLSPAQKHRLFQLAVQRQGWSAYTHPEMAARLGLGSDEVELLRKAIIPRQVTGSARDFVFHSTSRLLGVKRLLGPTRYELFRAYRGRPVEAIMPDDLPQDFLGISRSTLNDRTILRAIGMSNEDLKAWSQRRRGFATVPEMIATLERSLSPAQQRRAQQLIWQARGPGCLVQPRVAYDLGISDEVRVDIYNRLTADQSDFLNRRPGFPPRPTIARTDRRATEVWQVYRTKVRAVMTAYTRARQARILSWLDPATRKTWETAIGTPNLEVQQNPATPMWN